MKISIKEPKKMHENTKMFIEFLSTILPNINIYKNHPDDCEIHLDIIQDVIPKYLVITKKKIYQYTLKICEYRQVPTNPRFPISNDTQLVLNNFTSEIGTNLAHCLIEIFPCNVESKQVVNFTVKDEFLYFRMYQYCFSKEGPIFAKVGPHISFRLVKLVEYKDDEKVVQEFLDYSKSKCLL